MAETVLRIIDVGIAIKEAIDTARSNHRECEGIARVADQVCGLMRMLQGSAEPTVRHPAVAAALSSVLDSMREGLELVVHCGKKNIVLQLLTAQSTAKKLARVQREILQKISLGTLAVSVAIASRPQLSLGLPDPVHCSTRMELELMLGAIYNGEDLYGLSATLTPETSTAVAFAFRAAGSQATFLFGPGNSVMCGIGGDDLNCGIFCHILERAGVSRTAYCVFFFCGYSITECPTLSTELLDYERSLHLFQERMNQPARLRLSELTTDEDASTDLVHQLPEREDQQPAGQVGELAVEGAVIACHAKDELDAQLAKGNEAGKLVVINFMSSTCGPCQEIAPVFAECAKDYPTAAVFLEVDIHQLEEVATIFNIQRTPTFVFMKQNVTLESFLGTHPDKLRNTIKELIDDNTPVASASSSTIKEFIN